MERLVTDNLMEYPSILSLDIRQCSPTFIRVSLNKEMSLKNQPRSIKEFQFPVDRTLMHK